MSEMALTTSQLPHIAPKRDRSQPGRVTGRLKYALDAMVWDGLRDNEAAVKFKITVTAIRLALQRSHVQAYYRRQMEVLRSRERAKNIHRLCEIRDAGNNMPAVNAIKALELIGDESAATSAGRQAGITIVIQGAADVKPAQIIEHTDVNE